MMNRRLFLSKTAAATVGLAAPNTQQATFQYADGTRLHCEVPN